MNALREMFIMLQTNTLIAALLILLMLAVITDIRSRKIPNSLIATGLVVALVGQLFLPNGQGWQAWLLGILAGFFAFLPLYLLHGMAAGDVKLMSTVGAFVGWGMALKIALVTFVIGGIMGMTYVLATGRFAKAKQNIYQVLMPIFTRSSGVRMPAADISGQSVGYIPYAAAIALGTFTILYMQYWH